MNYIVLDFEFNQAFSFQPDRPAPTNPSMPCEIIQIGAVKLNETMEVKETYSVLVQPKLYQKMHPKVQKITGIRWEMLKNQPHFPAVYQDFLRFIGPEMAVLCSWGVDDIKALFRNIYYHHLDDAPMTKNYINVQAIAGKKLQGEDPSHSMGLQKAVELLQLPEDRRFHDALNDAYYTSLVLAATIPERLSLSLFTPMDLEGRKEPLSRPFFPSLLSHLEKELGRTLTKEEEALARKAYKLGRKKAFDIPVKKKKDKKDFSGENN
ncbi:MAG TPA: exonuclease domain-containing protein [Firmicutes bacterium]|nr:exonuclease domain-containing protein [Bacillota bacterium]